MHLKSPPQTGQDDDAIPGEWDEFDKVKPMHKGAEDDTRNFLDNPENADGDMNSISDKKDVDYQMQQEFIQISFKVNCIFSLCKISLFISVSVICILYINI